jgi:type VI secretion system protein VasJ
VQTAEMATPKDAQMLARKAAKFLVENENSKITGYRLMRCARWDGIEKNPLNENGKTKLPAPNVQQRTFFRNLVEKGDWQTVLVKGELAFGTGSNHFWFDLQRFIVTACGELGNEYAALRKALLIEMALLVKRLPDIVNFTFDDGFPFCDEVTKDWFASEVQSALGAAGGGEGAGGGVAADVLNDEQREVNKLVVGGKVEDALAMIQENMRSSSNERDNFRRTVMVGSLLLKAKQFTMAMSVLESLNQKIERHGLDRWDPDIAVEAWANLVTAYKAAKNQKPPNTVAAITDKQNEILSKISQLDPKKAFTLSK